MDYLPKPDKNIIKGSSLLLAHGMGNGAKSAMARPLRIDHPGPWYHIMNRGRRYEDIFIDDDDYRMFPAQINETSGPNYYHLLIQP